MLARVWNRREILAALGVSSASTLLTAFGCGGPSRPASRAPSQQSGQVRSWLREAVARLAAAYPTVYALAVTRRRTTAAVDVLGAGVARARRDGFVLAVCDERGVWREHASSQLSQASVSAAVGALGGARRPRPIDFPAPPAPTPIPERLDDTTLHERVRAIMDLDRATSSRIVYASALIDIDDVVVWSIAPDHDREHRTRRVRQRATRAAWNGTRPVVSEAERGWTGDLDAHPLTSDEVTAASQRALHVMTPGAFADGEATVLLDPGVTATWLDAIAEGVLTEAAARRPELARRFSPGASLGAPALALVDDPTAPGVYGALAFDDRGQPTAARVLVEAGRVVQPLERARRPGHVGPLVAAASHLVLAPGAATIRELSDDGWILEGKVGAVLDPGTGRVVIGAARARELKAGKNTGRVFADVELVGDVGALLAAVSGIGKTTETHVVREAPRGEPVWRSITAPWVRTHGFVRARRRLA